MTTAALAPGARRGRLRRAADRGLLGLALLVAGGSALVAWFALAHPDRAAALWRAVGLLGVAGVALGLGFVGLRHRLYARVGPERLLVLAAGALAPVVALEAVANAVDLRGFLYFADCRRYFAWQRYEGVPEDHAHPPDARLAMRWGVIETDANGWRTPPVAPSPPDGTLRVLFLGDSFAFGWGVPAEHAPPRALERALAGGLDPAGPWRGVEVVNTGNGSFTSVDELIVLEGRGLALRPHLVVLLFCSNDATERPAWTDQVDFLARFPEDAPGAHAALRRTARPRPPRPAPAWGPGWAWDAVSVGMHRSFLVVSALRALERGGAGADVAPAAPDHAVDGAPTRAEVPADAAPDAVDRGVPVAASPEPRAPAAELPDPGAPPALQASAAALCEIAATCRANGLPFVLFAFDGEAYDPSLRAAAKAGGGRFVRLRWPDDPKSYVNSAHDGHWNPAGVDHFVGQMVGPVLEAIRQVPRRPAEEPVDERPTGGTRPP